MPELWETTDLLDVTFSDPAAEQAAVDQYWLQFFGRTFASQAEEIFFNQIASPDRRLAAFVMPNVAGRVYGERGSPIASFRPAYIKVKHVIDASKPFVRTVDEMQALYAQNGVPAPTPQERFDAAIARNLVSERGLIERRWEWLACRAIADGKVTIVGEDYPAVTVDFRRNAGLTGALLGTARWGQSAANIMEDIKTKNGLARRTGYAPISRLTFGADAWDLFSSDPAILDQMKTDRRGSETTFNSLGITDGSPVQYMGFLKGTNGTGQIDLYTYANQYEDDLGQMQNFIDPLDVIGTGGAIQGVRAFGAIRDLNSDLNATPIYPRNYLENGDPGNYWTLSQSAPIMVPVNTNNSWRLRVG